MGVRCRLVRAEWALRAGTERVSLDRWLAEWTAAAAEGGRVVAAWPFSPFVSSTAAATAAVVAAAAEALSSFWCSLSTPALVTGWVDAAAAAAARVCSCCTSSCASVTTKTHTYG